MSKTKDTVERNETIPRKPKPLWRNQDYMLLWSGQIVSSTGTVVSQLALPLLILALTGSPAQAGFAGALRALPYLIFSLPAGALIDRWDRKRVMILCDTGRLIAFGGQPLGLALTGLLIQYMGAIVTILIYSAGLTVLAIAATLNGHVRHARPLAEIGSA